MTRELLPVGTKIRFTKTLEDGPSEERPAIIYALKDETGVITGHGSREGYWARIDSCSAPFGASREEFEPL